MLWVQEGKRVKEQQTAQTIVYTPMPLFRAVCARAHVDHFENNVQEVKLGKEGRRSKICVCMCDRCSGSSDRID